MRSLIIAVSLAFAATGCSATAPAHQDVISQVSSTFPVTTEMPGFGKGWSDRIAVAVIDRLMGDFPLTAIQASGIVGNLAHESGGFTLYQEQTPVAGRGGAGWAQWTGPRRRKFEAWAGSQGLDLRSFEANYGFLKEELRTEYKGTIVAVSRASSIAAAMLAFEATYERAGVKHYPNRQKWAERAYRAWVAVHKQT